MAESYFGITDTGRMRSNNEDTFIAEPVMNNKFIAACVIDGVGGYEGGELAASIARQTIIDYLKIPSGDVNTMMREALSAANEKIYGEKVSSGKNTSMACVLTLALVDEVNKQFYYAHIGDTRLYLLRDLSLVKLTKDHSFVGFLEDTGRLTEDEAMKHPKRNEINKALGFDATIPHLSDYIETGESPFLPGDMLLLCSDGLTDMLPADNIVRILQSDGDLPVKGKQLIDAANDAGGKDNITVVLVSNTTKSVKQKATKPVAPVKKNEEHKDELQQRPVAVPAHSTISLENESKRKGIIGVLSVLSLMLLGIVGWLWWQMRKEKETPVASVVSQYLPSEGAKKLQDTINRLESDTLTLSAPVQLGDTLFIDRDSLYLKGNGFLLSKDASLQAPYTIIKLQPVVSYFMLDSVSLQNIIISVEASNMEAIHFNNVPLQNSFVQLVQGFHYGDSILTGTLSDMNMRNKDTLPKKR